MLSRDTDPRIERLQIEAWRRMSASDKLRLVSDATLDALRLSRAGLQQRYPLAHDRERFLRLAELQLGPALVRIAYADASEILGPAV
jgi:hypothetical protein